MLTSLKVWNFALIEEVKIEFDEGLNILTGETGAGKSILIDALGAVLGSRLTVSAIRTNCEWLKVEAVFDIAGQDELIKMLSDQMIEAEDNLLILIRQVSKTGKNSILANGSHITLTLLRSISKYLMDIHGQNENLALLREENRFRLVDGSNADIRALYVDYMSQYRCWQELLKKKQELENAAKNYDERLDMLRWQEKEITDAELKEGEDEALEADIHRLSHAEKIAQYVQEAYMYLDEEPGGTSLSILSALAKVRHALESLSRYDDGLENARNLIETAITELQEAAYEVRDYGESMDADPARLDQMQQRLDTIDRLRHKYGATVAEILAHQKKIQAELTSIENYDTDLASLDKEIETAATRVAAAADNLSLQRKKAAKKLTAEIVKQIHSLGMKEADFHIDVTSGSDYTPTGKDQIRILFSANPGESAQALEQVASGGELSRIALAIKAVSAASDDAAPSMVFDEIDTGIGGQTARMVAERIALVADKKQVLCITHLPQIACMADVHLYIHKETKNGRTMTFIDRLSEVSRVNEIARMASGNDITAAALDNAREMVDNAKIKKDMLLRKKEK
ncbi:DNA repair protein RecN [Selenomonas sp. TAMA-11512]|uniref:DNA repair protein RecN n=1 Tax=Selenomonas sp. TAMA-11512 TaxID=3095337 RepID=UPI00308DE1F7|nr:DNA repair protein RecN [Selenomonas sp. TAMA-11512]